MRRLTWMPDEGVANAREVPVEVLLVSLHVDDDERRELTALLSADERMRADAFVHDRDRRRFIVVHARLRQFVAERTIGTRPETVRFTVGQHGKPALADQDLRFNLSHSDDLAAFAFAAGREVGIDIEQVRSMPDADAVVERFFSAREREAYRALPAGERLEAFFCCWTRKEAFMKAIGEGLACPLDSFDVNLAPGEPARLLRVGEVEGDRCGWLMHSFIPGPGFVGALAVSRDSSNAGVLR